MSILVAIAGHGLDELPVPNRPERARQADASDFPSSVTLAIDILWIQILFGFSSFSSLLYMDFRTALLL